MGLGPAITMGDQCLAYATGSVVLIHHHGRDPTDGQFGKKRNGFIDIDSGSQKPRYHPLHHGDTKQSPLALDGVQQKRPLP